MSVRPSYQLLIHPSIHRSIHHAFVHPMTHTACHPTNSPIVQPSIHPTDRPSVLPATVSLSVLPSFRPPVRLSIHPCIHLYLHVLVVYYIELTSSSGWTATQNKRKFDVQHFTWRILAHGLTLEIKKRHQYSRGCFEAVIIHFLIYPTEIYRKHKILTSPFFGDIDLMWNECWCYLNCLINCLIML